MALYNYKPRTVATAPRAPRVMPTVAAPAPRTTPAPAEVGDNNDETRPPFGFSSWEEFYASLSGGRSGGGSGTFTGETTPQRYAREAQTRGAEQQAKFLTDYLGTIPNQYQGLIGGVGQAFAPAREAAQTSYQTALEQLGGRRTQAETLAGQGQTALQTYLQQNAQRAYAQIPQAAATGATTDAVARYAQSIGVPVASMASAAQAGADLERGAVGSYNRLLSNLQASEAAQQASRLAELEMLRNVQSAGIQQLYGAGSQQLEAQRQAALNQIAMQESAKILAFQEAQAAEERRLRDALASLYGTGNLTYAGMPTSSGQVLPNLSGVDWAALGRLMGGR
jgi:hypothetical protein